MSTPSILLVDDDAWQLGIYRRTLEKAGFLCRTSPHLAGAIDCIDEQLPDVIILDVLLDGNTAFVLLNELQSDTKLANIPVIMASNIAVELQPEELRAYGVRRVLDKATAHPSDVVAAVKAVL